jgi:hypothetical protein
MRLLELFCGTKSIGSEFEKRGWDVVYVDNEEKFNPTQCIDILKFKPQGSFDVVWASPPCTRFSVASIGSSWCGNYHPKCVDTALGMAYVLKTLEIIKQVKPKYWFIENPRGVLRKMGFMDGLKRNTVTYCQYGDRRMKPTDIWTNCDMWTPRPMCKNGMTCHESAPRGARTGTQGLKGAKERSRIPEQLALEIFEACQTISVPLIWRT